MSTPIEVSCPKCQSPMKPQERNGVVIDRCSGCGGVFLDRGELERLVELEGRLNESEYGRLGEHDEYRGREEGYEQGRYGRKRRRGLLGELFDLG